MRVLLIRNLHSPLPILHYGGIERFNQVLLDGLCNRFRVTVVGNLETYHRRAQGTLQLTGSVAMPPRMPWTPTVTAAGVPTGRVS